MYKLGAIKDPTDSRDKLKVPKPVEIPSQAWVSCCPKIHNQGDKNSCTGHAASWFWESVLKTRGLSEIVGSLSASYIWHKGRELEGNEFFDTGVTSRGIMKALQKFGCCLEEDYPNSMNHVEFPGEYANVMAQALRLPAYERCETLEEIKYSIGVEDQPVCIGLEVTQEFYLEEVRLTGWIQNKPLPSIGLHMMVVVAYNDNQNCLILANSWGESWGNKGYLQLPYDYDFLKPGQFDAWTAGFEDLPDSIKYEKPN